MIFTREKLTGFSANVFERLGASPEKAAEVAGHLVEANLKGHDSHGVGMIPNYVASGLAGTLDMNADAERVRDNGSVILVDGHYGFGQVVGRQATDMAIERAKEIGLACVGARDCHHLGRIGTYGEQAAAAGLVSIHFVNVVGHPPFVAPWGGRDKRLQTNPFCCAVPTSGEPIVLDMATSAIALGKVRVAAHKGVPVPEGSLFDAEGVPTTDAGAIAAGGALGPFGQHKGYGLALICELLGGGLAGEWTMSDTSKQKSVTVNHMLMFVLDPDLFGGAAHFRREVDAMGEWIHSAAPAKGFDRVRLPGEPERETMAARQRDGIEIDDGSWGAITGSAKRVGMTDEDIEALLG